MQHTYASLGDVVQAEIYSDDEGAGTSVLFKYTVLECSGAGTTSID
jgi:hypothetical protein